MQMADNSSNRFDPSRNPLNGNNKLVEPVCSLHTFIQLIVSILAIVQEGTQEATTTGKVDGIKTQQHQDAKIHEQRNRLH